MENVVLRGLLSRGSSAVKALRSLSRSDPREGDGAAIMAEMSGESDRATLILISSFLEDILMAKIQARLRPLNSDETAGLFGPDRPLSSFSAKINLAYALRIIRKAARDDLNLIRELRNVAAHSRLSITLMTPEIHAVLMQTRLGRLNAKATPWLDASQARMAFLLVCQDIQSQLDQDDSPPKPPSFAEVLGVQPLPSK